MAASAGPSKRTERSHGFNPEEFWAEHDFFYFINNNSCLLDAERTLNNFFSMIFGDARFDRVKLCTGSASEVALGFVIKDI